MNKWRTQAPTEVEVGEGEETAVGVEAIEVAALEVKEGTVTREERVARVTMPLHTSPLDLLPRGELTPLKRSQLIQHQRDRPQLLLPRVRDKLKIEQIALMLVVLSVRGHISPVTAASTTSRWTHCIRGSTRPTRVRNAGTSDISDHNVGQL